MTQKQLATSKALAYVSLQGCLLYLFWFIWNFKRIRSRLAIPCKPIGFLGNAWQVAHAAQKLKLRSGPSFYDVFTTYILRMCQRHREEGLFAVHILHPLVPLARSVVIVCDMAIAKQVLSHKSYGLFRKGYSYRLSGPLVGDGLLSASDGPKWKLMRDLTNSGFKLPVLQRSLGTIEKVLLSLMRRWRLIIQTQGPTKLDIYEESLRLTLDVLGLVAFSHDFESVDVDSQQEAGLYDSFQIILSTLTRYGIHGVPPWLTRILLSRSTSFSKAMKKLSDTCLNLLQSRRTAISEAGQQIENDILESLLATDEHGHQRLTDACIVDNMKTLLFAGHDTTASALTWALYLLARHPTWQDRLRASLLELGFVASNGADINSLLPDGFGYGNLDDVPDLTAIVRETLRLYPSAGFTREAVQPVVLTTSAGLEYEVHPGTEIFFFPHAMHADPALFKDPAEFRPERWLDVHATLKQAWFPFSSGPRNCVGERLALAELRVALALLVTNFHFELPLDPLQSHPFQALLLSLQPYNLHLKVTEIAC